MLRHLCPRTNAYFCFVTNAERGLRQDGHNSTKISNIKHTKFPISITLFSLLNMNNFYTFSI